MKFFKKAALVVVASIGILFGAHLAAEALSKTTGRRS